MTRARRVSILACLFLALSLVAGGDAAGQDPLTPAQRGWLKAHGPLRYAPDPSFPPFEFFDARGRAVGITPDLLAVLARHLGIEVRSLRYPTWTGALDAVRRGEVDVLGTLTRTPEREGFLAFSEPYLSVPYGIFTRDDRKDIRGLSDLAGRRLGVVRNYGINDWLARTRPEIRPVAVENARIGLSLVATGQLDALLETLPVGAFVVREQSLTNIRLVPEHVYDLPQHLGVPKGEAVLLSILQRGLDSLTAAERAQVFVRWTGEDFSRRPVSPALRNVLVGLGVLAVLCLAWAASLRRGIDRKTRALQKSEADLREAYRQSARQEELYRSLLRSIPDPVALYALDGAAVYVNPSFTEVFGFSLEEVRERRIPFVPPEETERTLVEIRRVLGGEACRGFETRRLTRDGRMLDISLSSSVYHDHEGTPAGIVVVLRDVTARNRAADALRRSEESYRLLVENQTDLVVQVDPAGRFQFVSPSYCRMFGKTRDELLHAPFLPLVHEEDRELTARAMEALRVPPHTAYIEQRAMTAQGWRWLAWMDTAMLDERGEIVAVHAIGRDITDRRRAEEDKAALEVQLRHAQKMEAIGTLAGGIAHDFNNILSAIVGYADLSLLHLSPDDPERGNLEGILRASYRARDLVQQILAFSRPSAKGCGPLDPSVPAREALRLLRATLPSTIEMRERIASPAPSVVADPTELHQVVMNLCTNASHAMRERGGILEVVLEVVELGPDPSAAVPRLAPGRYVRLAVRDTGSGMDEETRRRAFEPYFTTKQVGEGSGLGLAVVHGIVGRRGGDVRLESGPGLGTCVEVFLPVADEAAEPAGREERRVPALPRGSERLLVVDDEPSVAEVSARMLASLGYRVEVAGSGADALDLFRADPSGYDLVVSDQTLPGMTGAALAAELLAARPGLPVVLCTGFSDQLDEEKAQRIGAKALLYKPFDRRKLATAVRAALDAA